MPTLPLYAQTLTAGEPESWHRINAPGGYETWQFYAAGENDLWAGASLSWGSTFLPGYLRRYERYRRRPTRYAPPVPKEHCSASFAVFQGGRQLARFDTPVNGDAFNISRGHTGVSVGANRMTVDEKGRLHLNLRGTPWRERWRAPMLMHDRTVSAQLVFEPVAAPMPRELDWLGAETPVHRYALSRPLCKVSGDIAIFEGSASPPKVVQLRGRGCHEHTWGTRPMSWDFGYEMKGHVFDEGRTFAFELLRHRREKKTVARIVGVDVSGARDVEVEPRVSGWARVGTAGLRFPRTIELGELLALEEPRVLAASLFDAHVIYEARWADRKATAVCRCISFGRLRNGVVANAFGLAVGRG
ncbi:MAG TPA: hypothetical protein VF669_07965 [Tepidisphaeraceae bacterium]|jgi:hypothetical protein